MIIEKPHKDSMIMKILSEIKEFIWDRANIDKNWIKHKVTNTECEEVFFDENKVVFVRTI